MFAAHLTDRPYNPSQSQVLVAAQVHTLTWKQDMLKEIFWVAFSCF